jgi:FHA domain-containing protein
LRFEVQYPQGGQAHEVTLQGTVAVIGRDPACELVVSDPKCSRRHAVLEAGPQGITIRDAGSANGVFVNDRKVERSQIKEGDLVRLGDVVLKVLPEDLPGTLMMGPEDMDVVDEGQPAPDAPLADAPSSAPAPPAAAPASVPAAPPPRRAEASVPPEKPAARPAPLPASAAPRPRPRAPSAGPSRPLTVTVLAVLWLLSIPLYGSAGLALARGLGWTGVWAALPVGLGLLLTLVSGIMGYGLWAQAPWARIAQIILAAMGLLFCPFTLASAAVLVYMARPAARAAFTRPRVGARGPEAPPADASAEGVFTAVILGTVLLGAAATGTAVLMSRRGGGSMEQARTSAREEAAVARLRSLAAAEAQFKSGTCVDAYADLEALVNPASAIPNYPADGPTFLPPEFERAEAKGYRFALTTEDPVPASEGCAVPGYRRFAYAAQPLEGDGRHLMVGADGVVHAAQGRPATPEDPAVR